MARSELTLGFVGSGKVEKRNAYALLRDLIEAEGGNVKFIFPLTKAFWNPALEVVSQYAIDNGIPVEAVVDDTTAKTRELKAMLTGARRQHQSSAVPHKMASLLAEARNGKLIVLWDDEDEAALDTVRAADEKGVALLELTRGLDRIELVAADDEPEPTTDEVDEEIPEDSEAEIPADADEDAGQEAPEEEIPEEIGEDGEQEDTESQEESAAAEDDLEAGDDEGEDEAADEFPEEEAEEFSLPEEDESDVAVLDMEQDIVEEVRQVTGMSEFQRRLLTVLEKTSDAFVKAIEGLMDEGQASAPSGAAKTPAPAKAASAKPAAARPAKKVTAPVKKAAKTAPPAKKATAPVKRTMPTKKAPAAAKPEENGKGSMSKAAAQKIIDAYRPRRGRPPADVTEARKVLGLA